MNYNMLCTGITIHGNTYAVLDFGKNPGLDVGRGRYKRYALAIKSSSPPVTWVDGWAPIQLRAGRDTVDRDFAAFRFRPGSVEVRPGTRPTKILAEVLKRNST